MNDSEILYHINAADECQAAGYSRRHNDDMVDMLVEKQDFYKKFPTRKARKSARKEGIKVGRFY